MAASSIGHALFGRRSMGGTRCERGSTPIPTDSHSSSVSLPRRHQYIQLKKTIELARTCIVRQKSGQREPYLHYDDFGMGLTCPAALKYYYPTNKEWMARNVLHFFGIKGTQKVSYINPIAGAFEMGKLDAIVDVLCQACPNILASKTLKEYYSGIWDSHGKYCPFNPEEYFALLAMIVLKLHPTFGIPLGRLIKGSLAHRLASETVESLQICEFCLGSKAKVRLDAMMSNAGPMLCGSKFFLKEDFQGIIDVRNSYKGFKETDLVYFPHCDEQGNLQLPGPEVTEAELNMKGSEIFEHDSTHYGKGYMSLMADMKTAEAEITDLYSAKDLP